MTKVYKEFLTNKDFTVLEYKEIIEKLQEINIATIVLSDEMYHKTDDNIVAVWHKTDVDHPLVLKKDVFYGNVLYVNSDWYVSHKKEADDLINYISLNTTNKSLNIWSSCFITQQVIDSLCNNFNLEEVELGSRYLEDEFYSLNTVDYLKFKKSNIKKVRTSAVDSELSENFDQLIDYNFSKNLIKWYTYETLNSDKQRTILIKEKFTDTEIFNLKYISPNISICLEEDAIYDVKKVCDRLNKLGINCEVILQEENKRKINELLFNMDIKYDNLFVSTTFYPVEYKNYLRLEKILYSLIAPAKNLSPFEQYIYAYNIAKKFKKYKEEPEDVNKSESRNLVAILENEYMVCVGFSNLFGDLLNKLGLNNLNLGIEVDISYDEDNSSEIEGTKFVGHDRRYVHIVDPKYEIDGFYVSDPTWDNEMEKDTYNFLALTDEEVSHAKRYVKLEMFDELFNVTSKEEFYKKINILIDRDRSSKFKQYESPKQVAFHLIEKLKKLDSEFVNILKSKYNYIFEYYTRYPDDVGELISDIGDYILSKVNKTISGETIFSAVENVYRTLKFYPEDRIEIEIENMKKDTIERQEKVFPKRSMEYEDGRIEEYDNYTNKFAIEEDAKKL